MTRRAGWPVRVALLAMALLWLVVGAAAPATAHSVGGAQASNYQTRIRAIEPSVDGLQVEVVDAGARLRLHNATGHEVVVLGDAGEPYLRLGPAGVFENRRSPATYRNRVRTAPAPPPAHADPAAPPEWRRLSRGDAVAWYEHRAHWMDPGDPPAVRAAPDRSHLVIPSWQVDLRVGGQPVQVTGEVRWIPGPQPWPWAGAAAGWLLAALAATAGGRRPRLVAALTGLLVAVDVAHTASIWAATSASVAAKAYGSLPSAVGWALAVLAVRRLLGSGPERAGVYLLLATVILVMVGGLGDLDSLSSSQLASALPTPVTRALVAATLGLGAALAIVGLRWSQPSTGGSGRRGPAAERGAC
jgi:hypothetical protein